MLEVKERDDQSRRRKAAQPPGCCVANVGSGSRERCDGATALCHRGVSQNFDRNFVMRITIGTNIVDHLLDTPGA